MATAWTSRDLRVDDAFITYRYARNIVSGDGWVYNAGEPHNTATSPLYTALVAGIGALVGDIPRAGHLIGSASLIACGMLTALIVAGAGFPMAGVLAGLFIVINPLLLLTVSMETPLFLALCAGAVLLASDANRVTSAVALASLATLTRGEAIVLLALIYGLSVWRTRRVQWWPVVVSLAIALPWALYATLSLGSPVPDSLGAKAALGVGLGMPAFAVVRQAPEILWQFGLATIVNFVPFALAPLGVARMGVAGWLLAVSAGAQDRPPWRAAGSTAALVLRSCRWSRRLSRLDAARLGGGAAATTGTDRALGLPRHCGGGRGSDRPLADDQRGRQLRGRGAVAARARRRGGRCGGHRDRRDWLVLRADGHRPAGARHAGVGSGAAR